MKQLFIVGFGIGGLDQLTLDGVRALEGASSVVALSLGPQGIAELERRFAVRNVTDADAMYEDGAIDAANYSRIARSVVGALEAHDRVAFLMYGHPRVGVSLTSQLEATLTKSGVSVTVIAGPSSFDAMINDLARDPLERGSVIADVNRLLLFRTAMDPAYDYYLYHVCSVGTPRTHFKNAKEANRFDLLQAHLSKFYSAGHPVELISSGKHPRRSKATVGTLESLLANIDFGCSMFVPGTTPRHFDRDFLGLLLDGRAPADTQASIATPRRAEDGPRV